MGERNIVDAFLLGRLGRLCGGHFTASKPCDRSTDVRGISNEGPCNLRFTPRFQSESMAEEMAQVLTHKSLQSHVHKTLCHRENLQADQFDLQVIPLKQQETMCGLQFLLRGPRSVRLGAVWAAEPNVLYFYDARGERFLKEQLARRPDEDAIP